MKNIQIILAYIIGLYVPLISGTGMFLTMTDKKVRQDRKLTTILQSQGIGAAIEVSGLMLLLHGINSGKTELGINLNKQIIMEHSFEALLTVCLSIIVSLLLILPTIDIQICLQKLTNRIKAIIGLLYIIPLIISYINVGTENLINSALILLALTSLSYVIVTLNKTNVIQIKSLAFIGLGLF